MPREGLGKQGVGCEKTTAFANMANEAAAYMLDCLPPTMQIQV